MQATTKFSDSYESLLIGYIDNSIPKNLREIQKILRRNAGISRRFEKQLEKKITTFKFPKKIEMTFCKEQKFPEPFYRYNPMDIKNLIN